MLAGHRLTSNDLLREAIGLKRDTGPGEIAGRLAEMARSDGDQATLGGDDECPELTFEDRQGNSNTIVRDPADDTWRHVR